MIGGIRPSGPQAAAAKPAAAKPDDPRIAQKARELESVMLGQLVQLMFQGVQEDGAFGGGSAEGQWKDLLAQEYGKAIANAGGVGLAVQIERELRAAMVGSGTNPAAGQKSAGGPHERDEA
jgi:Rod binding domain-containing protein